MITITNHHNRLLKITFLDKDAIHLLPNESLTFPEYFTVLKTEVL